MAQFSSYERPRNHTNDRTVTVRNIIRDADAQRLRRIGEYMGLILLLVVLVLLFGGGGFYMGPPYHYYGGGLGTILVIVIIVLLLRG